LVWTILSIINYAAVAVAIVSVLRHPREPRAMLAWILGLLLLPVLGLILFLLIGRARVQRTRRRRRRSRRKLARSLSARTSSIREVQAEPERVRIDRDLGNLVNLATRLSRHPPTTGNEVTIYQDAEQTFLALQLAIEAAREHVHMEYFIFQPDETGQAVRDLLIKKCRQGVRCRLLLDYVGCLWWPRGFEQSLVDGGVELAFFLPAVPWRVGRRMNFRNHRKILVVDGHVGFTGSQNIGDEYLGRRRSGVPWRDTHMRLIGPAVHQLQGIFIEDWHFVTGTDLVDDAYFPTLEPRGEQVVQVIPSGPDEQARVMHHLLFAAIAAAQRSVCIATPYFVPDTAMLLALQSAAYRGVRVQLLIPSQSNHRMALWAGRSFYPELSEAGVEVYEYPDAMLHSKVVVVDELWAMVGSANMDERSFRLNFEVTAILYDEEPAKQLHRDFSSLRNQSQRFKRGKSQNWTFGESLALGVARLTSPLL